MGELKLYGSPVNIKVIGLGGSGGNTVSRLVRRGIRDVEFIALNTDCQALALVESPVRLQLGRIATNGAGAGGNPELGRKAAEESRDEIAALLADADMVFLTCGMGGGTGTGAAPIVAEIARKAGAITVAYVGEPFSFEGRRRITVAENGLTALVGNVDSLVILPNDRLLARQEKGLGIDEAFMMADLLLEEGIQVITGILHTPGVINLDFADIKAVLKDSGSAFLSTGIGRGADRALEAAQAAISNTLANVPLAHAAGVLYNIVGSDMLTLHEVAEAAEFIRQVAAREANIIFGITRDPSMPPNEIKITLIAAGFGSGIQSCREKTNHSAETDGTGTVPVSGLPAIPSCPPH